MTLTEAIRELRRVSGLNQQYLATELKMSTRALSQYENGKTPEPKQLLALYACAHRKKRTDLCQIFADALTKELEAPDGFYVMLQYGPIADSPLRKRKK